MRGTKKYKLKIQDLDEFKKYFVVKASKTTKWWVDRFNQSKRPALAGRFTTPDEAYLTYQQELETSRDEPIKSRTCVEFDDCFQHYYYPIIDCVWFYKGFNYDVRKLQSLYGDDEIKLLIYDDYDKERRRFERLRNKYDSTKEEKEELKRPRIPEEIRIKVWQRDGGKCARCGSRDKLEYDHIVPVSKNGSNTLRNIELLCEECNRSKSNKIG